VDVVKLGLTETPVPDEHLIIEANEAATFANSLEWFISLDFDGIAREFDEIINRVLLIDPLVDILRSAFPPAVLSKMVVNSEDADGIAAVGQNPIILDDFPILASATYSTC
jgi:hypothetical protein